MPAPLPKREEKIDRKEHEKPNLRGLHVFSSAPQKSTQPVYTRWMEEKFRNLRELEEHMATVNMSIQNTIKKLNRDIHCCTALQSEVSDVLSCVVAEMDEFITAQQAQAAPTKFGE